MKTKSSISDIAVRLQEVSDNPHHEAKIILSTVLNQSFTQLSMQDEFVLSAQQEKELAKIAGRRLSNIPLAYCVGWVEFYSLRMSIVPGVLIPRPETEWLTEYILSQIQKSTHKSITITEFGIGSGAVLCSIGYELEQLSKSYTYIGWDVNSLAISNSSQNIKSLLQATRVARSSLTHFKGKFADIRIKETDLLNLLDLVTQPVDYFIANPPYIKSGLIPDLDKSVIDHEPLSALDGGKDGLNSYRQIHNLLSQHRSLYSTLPVLGLEIDPTIAAEVLHLFADLYSDGEIKLDLFGEQRYYVAQHALAASTTDHQQVLLLQ